MKTGYTGFKTGHTGNRSNGYISMPTLKTADRAQNSVTAILSGLATEHKTGGAGKLPDTPVFVRQKEP